MNEPQLNPVHEWNVEPSYSDYGPPNLNPPFNTIQTTVEGAVVVTRSVGGQLQDRATRMGEMSEQSRQARES